MKSNFVILAEPRTGSGALTAALNIQKDIYCLKELFKRGYVQDRVIKHSMRMLDVNNNLQNLLGPDYSKWEENRNKKFKDFLNIISNLSNKKIFGYKFFDKHFRAFPSRNVYLNFLKENNSKIIILQRKNILLRYISHMTAQSIKLYGCNINRKDYREKVFNLNPIKIDYDQYIKYNKKDKKLYFQKIKDAEDFNLKYIHIYYEDFTGKNFEESFKEIFNFLDLEFNNFINPRDGETIASHKKINIYKNKDKILNYTEFKEQAEKNNDIETLNFLKENNEQRNM